VIVGAVVSCTVTVKLHEAIKPASSVAVQVTVVVPKPKVEPEGGAQVTLGEASQLSVTVGEYVAAA
jgi:hypothetical protein